VPVATDLCFGVLRNKRRELIRRMRANGPIPNQRQLLDDLAGFGIEATQATISRDLHAMGVEKGPSGYFLEGLTPNTDAFAEPDERASRTGGTHRQDVREIEAAGTIVVVKTRPKRAAAVARELDRRSIAPIVGTIPGNDTVFVATPSPDDAKRLCVRLRELAGMASAERPETTSV